MPPTAATPVPPPPQDHTHPDTPTGPLDDSYSSTIHELMQHMLNTSGGIGGRGREGGGARTTSREDSSAVDHQLPREQLFTPASEYLQSDRYSVIIWACDKEGKTSSF